MSLNICKHHEDYFCLASARFLGSLTWACLLGSSRRRQPICADLVWIIPAETKLSGLGSMFSSNWHNKTIRMGGLLQLQKCSHLKTIAEQLGLDSIVIFHPSCCFKYFLTLLAWYAQVLPAGEKHLRESCYQLLLNLDPGCGLPRWTFLWAQ